MAKFSTGEVVNAKVVEFLKRDNHFVRTYDFYCKLNFTPVTLWIFVKLK